MTSNHRVSANITARERNVPREQRNPLWAWLKAENHHTRRRRTVLAGPTRRTRIPCTCPHTPKHHKKTGRCRRGCGCAAGIR